VKGPLAGQAIELAHWQIFILTTIYGWVKLTRPHSPYQSKFQISEVCKIN